MINWKTRIKSKTFWLALIPAILVLIQVCAAPFGYQWDFAGLQSQLVAIVNAVFVLLAILGIVVDPTTEGVRDSQLAMTYDKPKPYDVDVPKGEAE